MEAAMPAEQESVEVVEIMSSSNTAINRWVDTHWKFLEKLTPRGLEVQTCFTTTTVGGIVEGQQHKVNISTACSLPQLHDKTRQSPESVSLLYP